MRSIMFGLVALTAVSTPAMAETWNPFSRTAAAAYLADSHSIVVEGEVTSDQLTEGQEVTTVNGAPATITLEGGPAINGAAISTPDIQATNGVIHVIDAVILPPAAE